MSQLDVLMRRIRSTAPMLRAPVDELAARLHDQYPHDVGVFCAYLLNYIVLKPGEVIIGMCLGSRRDMFGISTTSCSSPAR